jgi:hypothetical protein
LAIVIGGGGSDIHPNTNPLRKRQSQSKICGLDTIPLQMITLRLRDGNPPKVVDVLTWADPHQPKASCIMPVALLKRYCSAHNL